MDEQTVEVLSYESTLERYPDGTFVSEAQQVLLAINLNISYIRRDAGSKRFLIIVGKHTMRNLSQNRNGKSFFWNRIYRTPNLHLAIRIGKSDTCRIFGFFPFCRKAIKFVFEKR